MSTWPAWRSGANRQVGDTQLSLLAEAADKPSGQLMLNSRRQNAQWCAMKRMVQRGLFDRQTFGADAALFGRRTVIYTITDAGRQKLKESR
jgi:hypothetical protein